MKKEKFYNPDKCSLFKMQFGFEAPSRVIAGKRKQTQNENKRESQVLAKDVS